MQFKGSFGLVVHNRKVALLLRDNIPTIPSPNKWCFIGGHADDDEEPLQTFVREVEEEINAISTIIIELPMFEFDGTMHGVYVMELDDSAFGALKLGDEGQKFEFFNINQLPELELTRTSGSYVKNHLDTIARYVD